MALTRAAAVALAVAAWAGDPAAPVVFAGGASDGMAARPLAEREGHWQELRRAAGLDPPRLRIAQADLGHLAAAHKTVLAGRPSRLRLNLLEGAEFDWIVERTARTAGGYSLSGPLAGVEMGTATLVANGGMVAGWAWTPEAEYRIRTAGRSQVVERVDPLPGPACEGAMRIELEPHGPKARSPHVASDQDEVAEDDGSTIDLLVVYKPQARQVIGGHQAMLAEIDLLVAWTNEAYAASEVIHRIRLVGAVEVDDPQADGPGNLWPLVDKGDGRMDEVHALRDSLAADVVVLMTGTGGSTSTALFDLDQPSSSESAFASVVQTLGVQPEDLAHALGHHMGAHHERGDERGTYNGNRPFPYSHGYFLRDPPPTVDSFSTIMTSWGGSLPRFSNPRQRRRGVALGVPGDEPSSSADGPADAVRSMNETRRFVANYRRSATRCRYRLSPSPLELPAAGGTYSVRVEADADCAWTAHGADGFTTVVSGASGAGDGTVTYQVPANDGWWREAALAVAGQMHVAPQPGTRPLKPVCERSAGVRAALEEQLGVGCEDITAADLSRIGRLEWWQPLQPLPGDFDGLSNLGQLGLIISDGGTLPVGTFDGLAGMAYLELSIEGAGKVRPGSFRGLENLDDLVLYSGRERRRDAPFPPGTFGGMPRLQTMVLWDRSTTTIAPGLFDGLSALVELDVVGDLRELVPDTFRGLPSLRRLEVNNGFGTAPVALQVGVFDGLSNLRELVLIALADVPPGVFEGLSGLGSMWLEYGAFTSLEVGAFDGLSSLSSLFLDNHNPRYDYTGGFRHRLATLPPGLFAGLTQLRQLDLGGVGLTELAPGTFGDVGSTLRWLHLTGNRLEALPAGTFDGATELLTLDLSDNRLVELEAGAFDGAMGLSNLNLSDNRLAALAPGLFGSLASLDVLKLHGNRLEALPPGLFAGAGSARQSGPHLVTLHDNPGSPFALSLEPVVASPAWQRPVRIGVRIAEGAPLALDVPLAAVGGTLEAPSASLAPGALLGDSLQVSPRGGNRIVVRIAATPELPGAECIDAIDAGRFCPTLARTGIALRAGRPLVLGAVAPLETGEPAELDLSNVFLEFDGADSPTFAVRSSDPAVASAELAGAFLRVAPAEPGTATVTVTATAADGRTASRTFTVTVPALWPSLRGWRLALLEQPAGAHPGGRNGDQGLAGKEER